jgi:hypothetical protein
VSDLRTALAAQLARKVDSWGLVVWNDPAGEYRDVAGSVLPPDTRFVVFDGSWYALRRRIDADISGERPPRLVVYAPAPAPADDPLAEVRAMAGDFKLRLATLIRQVLAGQLTQPRIDTIARTAPTLSAAEQAVAGDGGNDVRLITALGSSDTTTMLVAVLTGERAQQIETDGLAELVNELCRTTTGVAIDATTDRTTQLFTGLLLNDLALSLDGPLPGPLASATPDATPQQRRQSRTVLQHLRLSPSGLDTYRELAEAADTALDLAHALHWDDRFADLVGTPGLDQVAFAEAVRRLSGTSNAGAASIARARLGTQCPWTNDPTEPWGPRWRVIHALVDLRAAIAAQPAPTGSTAAQLRWYADDGWAVDRAHRRLELARTELGKLGDLDPLLSQARDDYDAWLDSLLTNFTQAVSTGGLDAGPMLRQVQVHDRYVADTPRRTAYVWVDALRFELAQDLRESLAGLPASVQLLPAVAAPPTITPIGMAALLPGAEESLQVTLAGEQIRAQLGGQSISTVSDRVARLRARHGTVVDLDLNLAANRSERDLHTAVEQASLVLVRSQEVDSAGESGMLAVAWSGFASVNQLLATVISRLAAAGIERVVLTADHGFIALSQGLGPQRVVDPPAGANGALKRRCFVGRGGVPNDATVEVPLAACGVTSDLDLTVPRHLAVFRAGGARQFFHGGLSPQELIVPLLVVDLDAPPTPGPGQDQLSVQVAGDRITTGVFAATVRFDATLFADRVMLRAVATSDNRPVARVVSGDGVSAGSDAITVSADRPSVLTFQVTSNLAPDEQVELRVLDAATGRTLATATVPVAAPILVEDDLD